MLLLLILIFFEQLESRRQAIDLNIRKFLSTVFNKFFFLDLKVSLQECVLVRNSLIRVEKKLIVLIETITVIMEATIAT